MVWGDYPHRHPYLAVIRQEVENVGIGQPELETACGRGLRNSNLEAWFPPPLYDNLSSPAASCKVRVDSRPSSITVILPR